VQLTAENTAIVVDSTADFPEAPDRFPNWRVVPLYVRFGDESFRDYVELTPEQFYAVMSEAAGTDLKGWFAKTAESADELDYTEALDYYGLRFRPVDMRNARPYIGGGTRSDAGRLVITSVRRGTPGIDATVAWVAMRSPVSNTAARYENAERRKNEGMIKNNKLFFVPWETIHESNPQEILDRHETITKAPFLIMQGALDDNVLPAVQERFAQTYRDAGGDIQYELFESCEHEWVAQPGHQTNRAREMVKAFIARQVNAS